MDQGLRRETKEGEQTSQRLLSSWKQRWEEERESWWNNLGGNSQIGKHERANENTSRANAVWLGSLRKVLYFTDYWSVGLRWSSTAMSVAMNNITLNVKETNSYKRLRSKAVL